MREVEENTPSLDFTMSMAGTSAKFGMVTQQLMLSSVVSGQIPKTQ
jgi:hypothetical protein